MRREDERSITASRNYDKKGRVAGTGWQKREWGNSQEGKRARKRKKGLEEVRKGGTQMETGEEQERMTADQIIEERRKRETEERGKRIRESKYNVHYRNIAKEKLPKYLEGRMKWKDRRILARFRCRNQTKAREYWKEEGEKRCRLCRRKEEDLRRVIEECEITGGLKDIGKTPNETGEGLAKLKAIIEKRRANDRKEAKDQSCNSF
uniref:uncharacterized protein LOC117157129 n=1 Tax=Bombus vancouverensis nearcticus TaxID=2705178 RepID=UPI001439FC6A|nr:uncharacterized protein LOC117157129 [Bombus vancouverensis nearcticus]